MGYQMNRNLESYESKNYQENIKIGQKQTPSPSLPLKNK